MRTLLEIAKAKYENAGYEYFYGGSGGDSNDNGVRDIDCSHLVYNALIDAGYHLPYMTTSALHSKAALAYFDVVPVEEAQPGDDLILYKSHVGILASYNSVDKTGSFFGSQTKNGPSIAKFSDRKTGKHGWGTDFVILRPKKELRLSARITAPKKKKSRWNTTPLPESSRPWKDLQDETLRRYLRRWDTDSIDI